MESRVIRDVLGIELQVTRNDNHRVKLSKCGLLIDHKDETITTQRPSQHRDHLNIETITSQAAFPITQLHKQSLFISIAVFSFELSFLSILLHMFSKFRFTLLQVYFTFFAYKLKYQTQTLIFSHSIRFLIISFIALSASLKKLFF